MDQSILLALSALGSAVATALIPRIFNKKKDTVDMFAEIQNKLYSEIDRLEKKIFLLEQREHEAHAIEEKLVKRIAELEQENIRQANEIQQLKAELEKYVKNN